MGRKKLPFYRIVAVDSKVRRDGAPLEYLGYYDPIKKNANLNAPAIKKWLSGGCRRGAGGSVAFRRAQHKGFELSLSARLLALPALPPPTLRLPRDKL